MPVKVRIVVLNWERWVRIPDCPAAVNSIMALRILSIAYLSEKVPWGGEKSEDQPSSERCRLLSM